MRVLFIDFDGVLHAVAGPTSAMKQFVWAPILESTLIDYPDVKLVVHASARDYSSSEWIVRRLGILGQRVVDVATPRIPRWDAIKQYLAANSQIVSYRILDDAAAEFPKELPKLIVCKSNQGLNDLDVQQQIQNWLRGQITRQVIWPLLSIAISLFIATITIVTLVCRKFFDLRNVPPSGTFRKQISMVSSVQLTSNRYFLPWLIDLS